MARPQKQGLDYFSLDVTLDDKFHIIEAEHGLQGFAICIKLLQRIYGEGYFYDWGEMEQILFSKSVSVDRNTVTSIVNDCLKWDLFDLPTYEKYQILTSRGIQKRFIAAVYKRVNVEMISEFLLIDINDISNITCISVSDIGNSDTSIVSDVRSTQSKVKKSKVKKSKEDIYSPAAQDCVLHSDGSMDKSGTQKDVLHNDDPKDKSGIPCKAVVDYLNKVCGTAFKHTTKDTQRKIRARYNEGYRLEDFKDVVDEKSRQWLKDPEMAKYLRPSTLFGVKFESYLNETKSTINKPSERDGYAEIDFDSIWRT